MKICRQIATIPHMDDASGQILRHRQKAGQNRYKLVVYFSAEENRKMVLAAMKEGKSKSHAAADALMQWADRLLGIPSK